LLKRAATGDPAAAKLVYQRFEKWSGKIEHKHRGSIDHVLNMTPEQREIAKKAVDYAVQLTMENIRKEAGSSDL